jgi:hypothetical protein
MPLKERGQKTGRNGLVQRFAFREDDIARDKDLVVAVEDSLSEFQGHLHRRRKGKALIVETYM